MRGTGRPLFREVQRFRQWWLWLLLLPGSLLLVGLFGYGMVTQLLLGRPWGDKPLSDTALAIVGSLAIAFDLALLYGFYSIRMVTELRPDALYVRIFPFVRRRIPLEEIQECYAREYNPITEYGGWGVRWGPSGRAYNVQGNQGVQLVLRGGQRLLVGSRRAQELAALVGRELERRK